MRDPVFEYILLSKGGTGRILARRHLTDRGAFKPIAEFYSYNDAQWIVDQLNGGIDDPPPDPRLPETKDGGTPR